MIQFLPPDAIERRSFEIILEEMGDRAKLIPADQLPLFQRVIHTSADFDYLDNLFVSPDAVSSGRRALSSGATVVTDTNMAKSGISSHAMNLLGCNVVCRMADPDVAREAKERGVTRAVVSMERAARETPEAIFAIGNAPTALVELCRLIQAGQARPSLLIGVPVGFVNVVESKEMAKALDVPRIIAMGRKGGSNVAAAIVNALAYGLTR